MFVVTIYRLPMAALSSNVKKLNVKQKITNHSFSLEFSRQILKVHVYLPEFVLFCIIVSYDYNEFSAKHPTNKLKLLQIRLVSYNPHRNCYSYYLYLKS